MRLVAGPVPALALVLLLFCSACGSSSRADGGKAAAPSRNFVIVELFTSEGCSSCPPADALLKTISEQQSIPGAEILALEEHVDYWDNLGWRDPFSNSEFTERQNDYARTFGNSGSYTPQMIVDGNVVHARFLLHVLDPDHALRFVVVQEGSSACLSSH